MSAEADLIRRILAEHGRGSNRLFRQNVGTGWAGRAEKIGSHKTIAASPGDVVVRQARPLHAGLCTGSSDVIGWRTLTITPDMVGQQVAVFTALEVKTGRAKPTKDQQRFLDAVTHMGGAADVVRSVADAARILGE